MRTMDEKAVAARFLLGGIGTGNISVDQNGHLCDFELWNSPNKGFNAPYSFFVVRCENPDGQVDLRALESRLQPPFTKPNGFQTWDVGGLPRFARSVMHGEYPFVHVALRDDEMPIVAELEAFTPCIPLNVDDSSIPGAVMRYRVCNIGAQPLKVSVAGTLPNLCGMTGHDMFNKPMFAGVPRNKYVEGESCRGLHYYTEDMTEADLNYFEFAFMTTEKDPSYLTKWNEGSWWDGLQDFWNDFSEDGRLTDGRVLQGKGNSMTDSSMSVGSLCVEKEIAPGGEEVFEFLFTWYRPNRVRSWWKKNQNTPSEEHPIIRNYYAKLGRPLVTAGYLAGNLPRLEEESRRFTSALYSTTAPGYVADAVASTITVLRSTTCFMVEDGTFFGWEGTQNTEGCCEGNCTHVWNYAQTVAFLFPQLERSMRRTEFLQETDEEGALKFRALTYMNDGEHPWPPAADGQLGSIVRLHREWRLSGDEAFLKELWPGAKRALEYATRQWDTDGDGVMDTEQHNTFDIEFYGPNSMMNAIFFAALKAGAAMARHLGEEDAAAKYEALAAKGAAILDKITFNGEYYEQKLAGLEKYKYQYGKGCLSDQLLGQTLAHVNGLGHVLDEAHVKSAVHAIFTHNFREDLSRHVNLQRTYALNDEAGLLVCTWPRGGRPQLPFVYCDEVWTGNEYQVATGLIYEGYVREGLRIVQAARARHDGVKRSPWNEVECGHHYVRSMASYGVLTALTGFQCDAVTKTLSFAPALNQDAFAGFFCCGDGWGVYHQHRNTETGKLEYGIETLYGDLSAYTVIARQV